MIQIFPRVHGFGYILNVGSSLSGNGSQMYMGPTPMSAALVGQGHDQNVPKGVRVQVFFEFLL